LLLLALLLTGCSDGFQYDINCPLIYGGNPAVLRLPYAELLNKGGLQLSIRAIPGRTDAVRVVAEMWEGQTYPTVEWTQEGCSTKKLPLENGRSRYDIEFHELRPKGDKVVEVKVSITYRAKSGPR
jgi:hypothetical protein